MIYKPQNIQELKQIDQNINTLLYEGINYQVYENQSGQIIKQYKFKNIYELNELIKTVDLEKQLSKETKLFYAPEYYSLTLNNFTINLLYKKFENILSQIIKTNQIESQQLKEDQQLYNELIDDNEKIFEVNQEEYITQLRQTILKLNVNKIMIDTILLLYDLSLQGIFLINIKNTNIIYGEENLQFMDNLIQSKNFEISLEEYLLSDFIKQSNEMNISNIKILGRCFMQLYLLIDFLQQDEKDYLELINLYHGQKVHDLLEIMLSGQIKSYSQLLQSPQFTNLTTPLGVLENKILFNQFFEKQKQNKEIIWDRIQQRFLDDKKPIWNNPQKNNNITLTQSNIKNEKQKPQAIYSIQYQIKNIQTFKSQYSLNGFVIINVKINDNYERGMLFISQEGKLVLYSQKELLKVFDCSTKALKSIIKFSYDSQILIAVAGDDKQVYIYLQNSFSTTQPELLVKISNQESKQIFSLLNYDNQFLFGDENGNIFVYSDMKFQTTILAHKKRCIKLLYFNDDVFSASLDTTIKVWDSKKYTIKHIITGHQFPIVNLFIQENFLYSFSEDKMLRLQQYNINSSKYEFIYQSQFEFVITSCIQYKEQELLFGTSNGNLCIYDRKIRKIIYSNKSHINSINQIFWLSYSQNIVLSLGQDKIIKINEILV